jgi:hypothetical protein
MILCTSTLKNNNQAKISLALAIEDGFGICAIPSGHRGR